MEAIGTVAHLLIPSTISIELHMPGTVLRGNDDIPAFRDNLESDLPIANVMWVFFGTTVQCKSKSNSIN